MKYLSYLKRLALLVGLFCSQAVAGGNDFFGAVAQATVTIPAATYSYDFTTASLPAGITFTRSGTAWCFNSSGTLVSVTTDTPCFDYDPATLTFRGMYSEKAATNLFLNSQAAATQNVTVTAQSYTLSLYGTGSITLSGTGSGTLSGTGANNRVSLTFTPTAGTLTLTVSGSVNNVQLETGVFATSPIVTAGTTVTRNATSVTATSLASFNTSAGTSAVDVIPEYNGASAGSTWLNFNDGTGSNYHRVIQASFSSGPLQYEIKTAAVSNGTSAAIYAFTALQVNKVAAAYNSSNYYICMNAGSVVSAAVSISLPTGINQLSVGQSGWIRKIRYWNTTFTTGQLKSVTH